MINLPDFLFSLTFSPLFVFALTAILNTLTFPRLQSARRLSASPSSSPSVFPSVSILIPMRDEASVIAQTIRSLLAQDYPNFEILLLDDHSTDGSADIARQAANNDPRLRIIDGAALPLGWLGKTWACHQLGQQATGDYLLFSDADVRWQPGALSALLAEARRTRADLLTAWPTQQTVTWGERLVVPLMGFTILAYLPVLAVHHIPWPVFAAAMGQCLLFRRPAYQQIGGHAAIRARIVDDMAFAYAIKLNHLRLRAVDANGLIVTRMYHNWQQVRNGFAKNILAGHGNSLAFLFFSTFFHIWLFIIPWVLLFTGGLPLSAFPLPSSALISVFPFYPSALPSPLSVFPFLLSALPTLTSVFPFHPFVLISALTSVFPFYPSVLLSLTSVFPLPSSALLSAFPLTPYPLLILLGLFTRALTAAFTRQRILDSFLMPVSVILMTLITIQAIQWHFTSGPQWKGRTLQ